MRSLRRTKLGVALIAISLAGIGCASVAPFSGNSPSQTRHQLKMNAARLEESRGHKAEAKRLYSEIHRQDPRDAACAYRLAVVCAHLNQHDEADIYYQQALAIDPNNAELLADMGYSAFLKKDYAKSEMLLQRSVKINGSDRRAICNLAVVLAWQEKDAASLEAFRCLNGEAEAVRNLAAIQIARGDHERGRKNYEFAQNLESPRATAVKVATLPESFQTPIAIPVSMPDAPLPPATLPLLTSKQLSRAASVIIEPSRASTPLPAHTIEMPRILQKESIGDSSPLANRADSSTNPTETLARTLPELDLRSSPPEPVAKVDVDRESIAQPTGDTPDEAEKQPSPEAIELAPELVNAPADSTPDLDPVVTEAEIPKLESAIDSNQQMPDSPEILPDSPEFDETPSSPASTEQVESNEPATKSLMSESELQLPQPAPRIPTVWNETSPARRNATARSSTTSSDKKTSSRNDLNDDELSVRNICLVTLLDEKRIVKASSNYVFEFQSQPYRFNSAEAMEKFRSAPQRYAPAAGGLDVVAIRNEREVIQGSLTFAFWYRRQLYLFSSNENANAFRREPSKYVAVK